MRNCLPLICVLLLTSSASAIVRRHDESDSQYISLGNTFPSAVWINCPDGFCSGTLIAPDWILTAAHCVDDLTNADFDDVDIGNGSAYDLGQFADGVAGVIPYPTYDGDSEDARDIALIQLDSPITTTPLNRHNGTVGSLLAQNVTFVGYGNMGIGTTGEVNDTSGTKRGGQNVIDRQGSVLGASYSNNLILTDFDGPAANDPNKWGSGTPRTFEANLAHGDSGGPWIVNGTIAGVSSFISDGFANNVYGEYSAATAVSPYNDWINSTMGGVNWNARGNRGFRTAANWGDGVVPGTTDAVRFSLPDIPGQSAPVISIGTGGQAVGPMTVEFGRHDLDINWESFTVNSTTTIQRDGVLFVREGRLTSTGTLDISTGGRLELPPGAEKALGIPMTNTSDGLFIGRNGTGTLNQNGPRIDVTGRIFAGYAIGSTGIYNQNEGAIYTDGDAFFGREGTGIWNNRQTARASITGDLVFGNNAQGYGVYNKQGGGLTSVTDMMVVGWSGKGDVTMSAGAISTGVDLVIGKNAGSNGNSFANHGGDLTLGRHMIVGQAGKGAFEQSAGTTTANVDIAVGDLAGGTGTLSLTGGRLNVKDDFVAGYRGKGTATITDGNVYVTNRLFVGLEGSGQGKLNLQGGQLNVGNNLEVGYVGNGLFQQTGGIAEVNGDVMLGRSAGSNGRYELYGGILDAGSISFGLGNAAAPPIWFIGGTLHVGTFNGTLNQDGGTLAPGSQGQDPTGRTRIEGGYLQNCTVSACGKLAIEIGGLAAGDSFDDVVVTGDANLGGVLDVSLVDDYVPPLGQPFVVLTVPPGKSIINNGLTLGGAAASMFKLLVGGTSVILEAVSPSLPGDFNIDGVVDAADYVVWRKNPSGVYTQDDYNDWRTNFGSVPGSGALPDLSPSVPEPLSALLAMFGGIIGSALFTRRR